MLDIATGRRGRKSSHSLAPTVAVPSQHAKGLWRFQQCPCRKPGRNTNPRGLQDSVSYPPNSSQTTCKMGSKFQIHFFGSWHIYSPSHKHLQPKRTWSKPVRTASAGAKSEVKRLCWDVLKKSSCQNCQNVSSYQKVSWVGVMFSLRKSQATGCYRKLPFTAANRNLNPPSIHQHLPQCQRRRPAIWVSIKSTAFVGVNQGLSNNTQMSRLFNTLPKQLEDDTSDIYQRWIRPWPWDHSTLIKTQLLVFPNIVILEARMELFVGTSMYCHVISHHLFDPPWNWNPHSQMG